MSQQNVEVVKRLMDAFRAGDHQAALAAYHPEVVCDATVRPEGGMYRGREGVAEAIRVWGGTWDDWKWEIDELIDGGDRVLMVIRESGRGKGSGVVVVQETFWVYALRDGQIVYAQVLVDRGEALKAVGLEE